MDWSYCSLELLICVYICVINSLLRRRLFQLRQWHFTVIIMTADDLTSWSAIMVFTQFVWNILVARKNGREIYIVHYDLDLGHCPGGYRVFLLRLVDCGAGRIPHVPRLLLPNHQRRCETQLLIGVSSQVSSVFDFFDKLFLWLKLMGYCQRDLNPVCHRTWSALVQVMACHVFEAKPLHKPLTYYR